MVTQDIVPLTIPERIKRIQDECRGVYGLYGVNRWERERLAEWRDRRTLTEAQLAVIRAIEKKVFPDG